MLAYIFLTQICFTEALKKNTMTAKVNQQEAEKWFTGARYRGGQRTSRMQPRPTKALFSFLRCSFIKCSFEEVEKLFFYYAVLLLSAVLRKLRNCSHAVVLLRAVFIARCL